MSRAERLKRASRRLARELGGLSFGAPVTHVYNPLVYARDPWEQYLARYGDGRRKVVFLGMNPGPFGMAQTGVPFGSVEPVHDWLGIEGRVRRPEKEHPKRPVRGFACTRREVSGERVWGALRERFGTPQRFFRRFFITNYCPLLFMEASGRNRTPDKLSAAERAPLFAACDRHLRQVVEVLEPELVVGIGRFAEGRAREVLEDAGVRVGGILHPSPANPQANRDWAATVAKQLGELGACGRGQEGDGPAPGRSPSPARAPSGRRRRRGS